MTTNTVKKRKKRQRRRPSHSPPVRHHAVTEANAAPAKTRTRKPPPRRRRPRIDPSFGQIGVVAAVVLAAAFFLFGGRGSTGGEVQPRPATAFTLPSTAGGEVSLSDHAGHNVLLYFNEGVGCDACFTQTVELERAGADLPERNIALVPIVMNPIESVRSQLDRFGIVTPYLIDVDGSVSRAYDVLGKGMHANLPGHAFVFIDPSGRVRWEKEYPSMYASASEILGAVDPYLA